MIACSVVEERLAEAFLDGVMDAYASVDNSRRNIVNTLAYGVLDDFTPEALWLAVTTPQSWESRKQVSFRIGNNALASSQNAV